MTLALELYNDPLPLSSPLRVAGYVPGQSCDIVDLDGPGFLAADRSPGVGYEDGHIFCGDEVWGPGTAP